MTCDDDRLAGLPEGSRLNLVEAQLGALYEVGSVLSRSLNLRETLREVLTLLNDRNRLSDGMVCLVDQETGELLVSALHDAVPLPFEAVRYRPGEGVIGRILERNETWILPRVGDETRFLDRLGVYNPDLPFIGVPIRIGEEGGAVGVFAAQPTTADLLESRARFLEMVANLIGQACVWPTGSIGEQRALREERDKLRREVKGDHGFESMVGHASSMRPVFDQVRQVAKWNTTVLIRGESGTGKELIANAIHYNSPRARGAFVKLNCAALPDNLLESELFGHEKGAFTGAVDASARAASSRPTAARSSSTRSARSPPAFQAKLLRVLQEGEFERVGGSRTLKVDVRVIAATNRDLEAAVRAGRLPRGPLLPPQRHAHPAAAAARAHRGHPRPGALPDDQDRPPPGPGPELSPTGPCACSCATAGPATCASWRTAWSGPRSCPRPVPSIAT